MTAGVYNIQCEQGADVALVMTFRDTTNVLLDFTGAVARMQVRRGWQNALAEIDLTSASGVNLVLGGAAGTITLFIPGSLTAGLPTPSDAVYDLLLTASTGKIQRLLQGKFLVSPAVTR